VIEDQIHQLFPKQEEATSSYCRKQQGCEAARAVRLVFSLNETLFHKFYLVVSLKNMRREERGG
jgi:hypothetical protein